MGSEQTKGEQSVNFKLVLKAYSTLRQLSDDESALLATLRDMNDSEREALVVAMQPERTTGKKKAAKKTGGKSPRASAMAATLGKNLAQQRAATTETEDGLRCSHPIGDGVPCDAGEHSPIHDKGLGYLNYHPFVSSSTARPAAGKSSTSDDGASSETDSGDASVAVGAGSGGN
jgi:hypothetical protein